ncbi:FAS-associated death domain protein [Pelobates fuscus]|uniref:FAS-associated death domain protein n=1 Tax=Pelobates fuscus TaxID=191477 RepID=UPI002FE477A9
MDDLSIMLLGISTKLDDKELKDLKFLCREKIFKKRLESINSATDLFTCLMELNEISNENLDTLIKLLKLIKRDDLVNIVDDYQIHHLGFSTQPERQERSQLDQAFDIICENLGSNWKMLMRRLGVTDVILERAVAAHPYSMYEQQMQCFKDWRRMKGEAATVSVLCEALRSSKLKLIEDILTEKLELS